MRCAEEKVISGMFFIVLILSMVIRLAVPAISCRGLGEKKIGEGDGITTEIFWILI